MTDPHIPVTEDELHAYVDNELPAERRGDVEAWLVAHPDDAARVQSWRAMAEALHARYDSVADEAVPKRLEIERLVRQPRKWVYGAMAATLAAFIAGSGVGWVAHGAAATPTAFQSFTVDALDAHRLYVVEVRHPVEVPGSERAHLQAWLTKRCGWDVRAPELAAAGSTAGGLGFVPAGYLSAQVFAERVTAARRLASGPGPARSLRRDHRPRGARPVRQRRRHPQLPLRRPDAL